MDRLKFNNNSTEFTEALNSNLDPKKVNDFVRECMKEGMIKTVALEKTMDKYDPKTMNDVLLIGIVFGGVQAAESMVDEILSVKLNPELMKHMFNNLVDKAFNIDDLEFDAASLNKEEFKKKMGDNQDDF